MSKNNISNILTLLDKGKIETILSNLDNDGLDWLAWINSDDENIEKLSPNDQQVHAIISENVDKFIKELGGPFGVPARLTLRMQEKFVSQVKRDIVKKWGLEKDDPAKKVEKDDPAKDAKEKGAAKDAKEEGAAPDRSNRNYLVTLLLLLLIIGGSYFAFKGGKRRKRRTKRK